MTVQSTSWNEVAQKFEAISKEVRRHVESVNEEVSADWAAFGKAVHAFVAALEDSLHAPQKIARDPALHKELAGLATTIRSALQPTFSAAHVPVLQGKIAMPHQAAGKAPTGTHKPATKKSPARKVAPPRGTASTATRARASS